MPALVNMGAVGWCGMRPDDGTTAWPRSTKKSSKAFRSWLESMAVMVQTSLPALSQLSARFEALAELLLGLPHALPALGHGIPEVGPELAQGTTEVGRHPLGAVALHR